MNRQEVLATALLLSAEERAALAAELIESLEEEIDENAPKRPGRSRFATEGGAVGGSPAPDPRCCRACLLTLEYLDEALFGRSRRTCSLVCGA